MNFFQAILKVAIYWGLFSFMGVVVISFAMDEPTGQRLVMILWLLASLIGALIAVEEEISQAKARGDRE
ncbi:hypothetical protein UFOVP233_33 [uncultured Caudovirales phage]|uniref:Uncharacterized protein n=1 Tax=uncultured Caudovirales phage TaxID=2100421 RepID=A0A6J7WRA8_9CAUD|nr:hypothetical protein UFOVP233_33 [uncultured Caudovirales phage]